MTCGWAGDLPRVARTDSPDDLPGLRATAEAAFADGRLDEAEALLLRALELARGAARADVLGDLAVVTWSAGRGEAAVGHVTAALDLQPDHVGALEVLDAATKHREAAAFQAMRPLLAERAAQLAAMSTCLRITGRPYLTQPTLLLGRGRLVFGETVEFGVPMSPEFLTGYGYVEARSPDSVIEVGSRTTVNNSCVLVAEGEGITIGTDCLLGVGVSIGDSDGHDLHPERRRSGRPATAPVRLGRNVFLGNGVRVTKGVTIGDDTVVGAGSTVVRSLPAGVVAAGVPARVLREL